MLENIDLDTIKKFLNNNNILVNEFDELVNNSKFIDIKVSQDNLFLFGVYENKIVVPVVKDIYSALVVIHEFVHQHLLNIENEINDLEVICSEVLPIFYEYLFVKENCPDYKMLCLHYLPQSFDLLENHYKNNIFEEVVEYKKMLRTRGKQKTD